MLKTSPLVKRFVILSGLGLMGVIAEAAAPAVCTTCLGLSVFARETTHVTSGCESEGLIVRQRIAVKECVISEMIEGNLSLTEATAAFMDLNRGNQAGLQALRTQHPGTTFREMHARNVLYFASCRTPTHLEGGEVMGRLQCEFEALRASEFSVLSAR